MSLKLSQIAAGTGIVDATLFYGVDDPGGTPTEAQYTGLDILNYAGAPAAAHAADASIHFTVGSIDHTAILNVGTNTHAQIDAHIAGVANPHSVTASQVGLGNVQNILNNFSAVVAPGVSDDSGSGYSIGSRWIDLLADEEYTCLDASVGAAVWTSTTAAAGGAVTSVFTRTGAVVAQANDYTWAQIDKTVSDLADITTKSHTSLTDIGSNTHAQIDTHIGDATTHFTVGSIDHTAILNIGSNTHAQIDSHISSTSNPHSVSASDVGLGNVANVDQLPRTLEVQDETGAGHTLVSGDNGKLVIVDNTLTIPTGLAIGFQCSVFLDNGTAQTLTTTGLTVKGKDANANITGNGIISVAIIATNTVLLAGDMEA